MERLVEITAEEYDVLRASGVWVWWDCPPFASKDTILKSGTCHYPSEKAIRMYESATEIKYYTKVSDDV